MALDRETTLKKAEKLLRQGRLEAAIAEYRRVVDDQPRDWTIANTLGDLYARAGQTDDAVAQYSRIADHFFAEGFYPKAAALYKKILKINRDDEATQLQLAETSVRQGLVADARSYFNAVAAKRRIRSDRRGEAEIVVRLASIDSADFEARLAGARALEQLGAQAEAAATYKALHDDLLEKGRTAEAVDALRQFARLEPNDAAARITLARAAVDAGDLERAREVLDRETAGGDPALLRALAEIELRSNQVARASEVLALLAADPVQRLTVVDMARTFAAQPAAAFACIESAVDAAIAGSDFSWAVARLQEFVDEVPGQIPALLKLVEVCVDAGLEPDMYKAQEQLTDAYLAAGQAAEARVIAEDLVAREPWEQAHIDRFRRALVMLRIPEPDTVIADRLSGQSPFTATDPFADVPEQAPQPTVDNEIDYAGTAEPLAAMDVSAGRTSAVEPTGPVGVEEIDLTAALASAGPAGPSPTIEPTPAANLDDVFQKIRDEAAMQRDFSEQHLTLGRTFLQMGRADEAIEALKTASRSPRHRFEAASLLGRIYRQQGDIAQTIEWLERAAEAPPPGPDAGRALLYDLGVVLDESGDVPRALAVFLELQADAGDYRDVPGRIERLARVQTGG